VAGEVESRKTIEPDGLSRLIDRLTTREALICIGFVLITFFTYWHLGPKDTAYNFQVSQANNLIHGHLDLRPEDSRNLGVLERVLYDGEHFCLPAGDEAKLPTIVEYNEALASGTSADQAAQALISPDCKLYMQHSLGPALMVIPGVLIWGTELNQALVSAVIGAMTAAVVYQISRKLSPDILTQVSLTALMMFGTIFWWVAANGGVWFFAHTTAVFFLFGAIYFTLVRRNPLAAGALLGAAYMCRPSVIAAGLFFVVMFSDLWLKPRAEGQPQLSLSRIDWRPAMEFAVGIAPFVIGAALLNYFRYDSPLEYGYNYVESSHQVHLAHAYRFGNLDVRYMNLHPPVIFGTMPYFQRGGAYPFVFPSWLGMAIWVSTPAFFLAFFANIKKYAWIAAFGALILALAAGFMLSRAIAGAWHTGWSTADAPLNIHFWPFWLMIAVAVGAALYFRDRLSMACWAAIIPTAITLFMFAFVGYAQFGYRYSLDFTPFLWLLVAHAVGDRIKWYHLSLIAASIAVNFMGVLWIYQFEAHMTNGWSWVSF